MTILLVAIHTLFGLHVLRRNIVFIDLALAQMAALGATVAFTIGYPPLGLTSYAYSFAFTLVGALLLSCLRFLPRRIPHEALIGILYVVAAAVTILFIEKSPQGAEHLKQLLTGNIVTVEFDDAFRLLPIYGGIALLIGLMASRGGFARSGFAGWFFDLVFYALFGAVVTSSVSIAGVLLVFSFLIIPACIGSLLAGSFFQQWLLGVLFGSCAGALGLAGSYYGDLSAGATVVCAFGAMLATIGIVRLALSVFRRGRSAQYLRGIAVAVGGVLVASGIWSGVSPRADQPLLNSVERMLPSLRGAYLSAPERQVIAECAIFAARYQAEAERLNRMEADDRVAGKLSDEKLAKIASFVKANNEMRAGEEFVAMETVARARTRHRFGILAVQAGLGLALWFLAFPTLLSWGGIGENRKPPARSAAD